jgi:hypothetical protein
MRRRENMDLQIIDLAEQLLQEETEFIVPVKKIWLRLSLMGKLDDVAFESFSLMLQGDERFEIFDDNENELHESQIDSLEEIGFFMGPRVMLKSRKPSRKEMGVLLIKKTSLIYENLKHTWDQRDRNNEEEEDQLIYALASTQKLLKAILNEFPECQGEEVVPFM